MQQESQVLPSYEAPRKSAQQQNRRSWTTPAHLEVVQRTEGRKTVRKKNIYIHTRTKERRWRDSCLPITAAGNVTWEPSEGAWFSWLTLVITPESISDSISVCLNKDKETKMPQRQLNATSPHLEYSFGSEGRSPHRSGQQDPQEAHLLWHRCFSSSNGSGTERMSRTIWNLSSCIEFPNTWLSVFPQDFKVRRDDHGVGLCSAPWQVITVSPLCYKHPCISIPIKNTTLKNHKCIKRFTIKAKLRALTFFFKFSLEIKLWGNSNGLEMQNGTLYYKYL